jgi:hypothetical protein
VINIHNSSNFHNDLLKAALSYATFGWRVFPVHTPTPTGACSCGHAQCVPGGKNAKNIGKHPRTKHGANDATTDTGQICQWWATWPDANVAIATGPESGILVLDLDGECELPPALQNLPHTIQAKTGHAGGRHKYFQFPPDCKITIATKLHGLPIDVRGATGYVLAPPSLHASSAIYAWLASPGDTDLALPPAGLLEWIVSAKRIGPGPVGGHGQPCTDVSIEKRAIAYLAKLPSAISGQGGHNATMLAARAVVYGFDLGPDKGYQLLTAHYNPRCEPPWTEKELRHKVKDAHCKPFDKPRGFLLNGKVNAASHPNQEPDEGVNPFSDISDELLGSAPPPDQGAPPPPSPDGGANDQKKLNIATKIVLLAQDAGTRMWHTPDNTPFATIRVNEHRENYPIKSTAFRNWLSRLYYKSTHEAANANAIADAVAILAAIAVHDGDQIEAFTRVARDGNNIYLDLADGDWRTVEVSADGWRIVTDPPVMFRRPTGMYPLPEPKRGGLVDRLRPFVNTKSEAGYRMIVAHLVASFRPGRPFSVLLLLGEQGSAKSTLARLLRALIDPNKAPIRRPPRDDRDTIIAATNGWVIAYDNLSFIPDWLSDSLCCLATGAGFGTRTLYTDSDETLFQATRPIILTAIEDVVTRADLMDRCLCVELEPIPDSQRRTEVEIEAEFSRVQPLILGALLDGVAVALRSLPTTRLSTLPRMADFALWVTAAEPALGWTQGAFLSDYATNRQQSTEAILADSLIYDPLVGLLDSYRGYWQGTPTGLLDALAEKAGDKVTKHKSWPTKPAALTNRLKRLAPALRAIGITVERDRAGRSGKRVVTLRKQSSASSASSASGVSDGPHADDTAGESPVADGDADNSYGQPASEKPRKSRDTDETDDTNDLLRPSHDSDYYGPYKERF